MVESSGRRPRPQPDVTARTFSGEAVVVDTGRNVVRMLNPVGSRIWELADGNRTEEEIASELVQEYEVSTERALQSVERFVEELVSKGLLTY